MLPNCSVYLPTGRATNRNSPVGPLWVTRVPWRLGPLTVRVTSGRGEDSSDTTRPTTPPVTSWATSGSPGNRYRIVTVAIRTKCTYARALRCPSVMVKTGEQDDAQHGRIKGDC